MTSSFQREDLPPTAKTHGLSQIGLDWSVVESVEANKMLSEVQIGGKLHFFSRIFAGFEQNPLDLSKVTLDLCWIWGKPTRFKQKINRFSLDLRKTHQIYAVFEQNPVDHSWI